MAGGKSRTVGPAVASAAGASLFLKGATVAAAALVVALPAIGFAVLLNAQNSSSSQALAGSSPRAAAECAGASCDAPDARLVKVTCRVVSAESGPLSGAHCLFEARGTSVDVVTGRTGEASVLLPDGATGRVTAWAEGHHGNGEALRVSDGLVLVFILDPQHLPGPAAPDQQPNDRKSDPVPTPQTWPKNGPMSDRGLTVSFNCVQVETTWMLEFTPTLTLPFNRTVAWFLWDFGDGSLPDLVDQPEPGESYLHDYVDAYEYPPNAMDDFEVVLTVSLDDSSEKQFSKRCHVDVPYPCPTIPGPLPGTPEGPEIPDDLTVVAIIDSGLNPYHWDFLASMIPADDREFQELLCHHPSTWLPGWPAMAGPNGCELEVLELRIDSVHPDANSTVLHDMDSAAWGDVQTSQPGAEVCHWIPGTKVISLLTFMDGSDGFENLDSHGTASASVAVGNIYGACPRCLLVFSQGLGDPGTDWVAQQPWIDAQSNSWGVSTTNCPVPPPAPLFCPQDNVYTGSAIALRKSAITRGQAVFQSAGNGVDGAFSVQQSTLYNAYVGPDWVVTVGAFDTAGALLGTGKPADIASLGTDYPAAYNELDHSVTANGPFSGTSNASPVVTGTYARALDDLRVAFPGASTMQAAGVIALGPSGCGAIVPACAMSDGVLTNLELIQALYTAAQHTLGENEADTGTSAGTTNPEEALYMSEGHGGIWGRLPGAPVSATVENARIRGNALGTWTDLPNEDLRLYMIADSYCRQQIWGAWNGGYWRNGDPLPPADSNWPYRQQMTSGSCQPAPET